MLHYHNHNQTIIIIRIYKMMEFTLDYASLAKKLENQELESTAGRASPQVYGQLLAIYILFNDLTSAKLLWKRIPDEIKQENVELSVIWSVGRYMWKKEYPEIYKAIGSCPLWPNHLKNIMNLIIETTRKRAEELITKAYSTVRLTQVANLLGLTEEQTPQFVASRKWVYETDTGFVVINKNLDLESRNPTKAVIENCPELLEKLTDYILFLENPQTSH